LPDDNSPPPGDEEYPPMPAPIVALGLLEVVFAPPLCPPRAPRRWPPPPPLAPRKPKIGIHRVVRQQVVILQLLSTGLQLSRISAC